MTCPDDHESGSGAERIPPRCSFCKKAEGDGVKLIEGPILEGSYRLYICGDCAELCSTILEMERTRGDPAAQSDAATRETLSEKVDAVLGCLSDLEREVIKRRFGLADGYTYTLEEVARIFEITRERVREIEAEAVAKLQSRGLDPDPKPES